MLKPSQLEQLKDYLKDIVRENKLDGLILSDVEGLALVSYLSEEDIEEDTLAAAGAAIFTASLMTISDVGKQGVEQVVIQSPDGFVIFTQITEDIVLGLIAPYGSKLGILKMIVKEIQEKVQKLEAS